MIILGIDPGIATTGFGVIKYQSGKSTALDYGVISTTKDLPHPERLAILQSDLLDLINKHQPDRAVVEKLFFATNARTAMTVGEARGVILVTLQQAGLAIFELTPLQIKQATTGYGQAKKPQMQLMVQKILKLTSLPKPDDAADALAIALAGFQAK